MTIESTETPKSAGETQMDFVPTNPKQQLAEELHTGQAKLFGQLRTLGIIGVIEEVTGRQVPSMEDLFHRESSEGDQGSYLHPTSAGQPSLRDGSPHRDARAWGIRVLGINPTEESDEHERSGLEVDRGYLPRGGVSFDPLVGLEFSMKLLIHDLSLVDVVTLHYNGHGMLIRGANRTFTGPLPEDPSKRVEVIKQALTMALMQPDRRMVQSS